MLPPIIGPITQPILERWRRHAAVELPETLSRLVFHPWIFLWIQLKPNRSFGPIPLARLFSLPGIQAIQVLLSLAVLLGPRLSAGCLEPQSNSNPIQRSLTRSPRKF